MRFLLGKYFSFRLPNAQARMDLDERCNLKCDFCFAVSAREQHGNKSATNLETIEKTFKTFSNSVWSVYLSCAGEPLISPHFSQIMDLVPMYLADKEVHLITNATMLSEKKAKEIIKSGISQITFSIDSLTKERYEKIRSGAKFEKTIKNIKRFIELKGGRAYPKINITMILMESNIDELENIMQFCIDNKIDSLKFQNLEIDEKTKTIQKPVHVNPELRKRLKRIYFTLFKKGIVFQAPAESGFLKIISVIRSSKLYRHKSAYFISMANTILGQLFTQCRFVGNEIIVDHSGAIYSCLEKADHSMGSQTSLENYLKNSRKKMLTHPFSGCYNCRFFKRQYYFK